MRYCALFVGLTSFAHGIGITGTVYLRQAPARQPMPGVQVAARRSPDGVLVATTTTDTQGRFQFPHPPRTRLSIGASKPGYSARAVASGESILLLDAGAPADVNGSDFELFPGGVVTGRITDQWNEPLEKATVTVYLVGGSGVVDAAPGNSVQTDDRGHYRIFGLEPGRYVLLARLSRRLNDQPPALFYPGSSDPSRARAIEVSAGAETTSIDVAMRPEPTFRIAGKLAAKPAEPGQVFVQAAPGAGLPDQPSLRVASVTVAPVTREGNYVLAGLTPGAYVVTAVQSPGRRSPLARQIVDLRADVTDLVLRPARSGRLDGRVTFSGTGNSRRLPASVRVRLKDRASPVPIFSVAQPPDYRFEIPDLWPGSYTIELLEPAKAYLGPVRLGSTRLRTPELVVPDSGGSFNVDLEVGLDPALVTGLVKAPASRSPQPHVCVVLASPGSAPVGIHAVQSDQNGRFAIEGVRPSEYLIGAWACAGPRAWDQAKRLLVEPNTEIDLELTVAP